MGSDRIWTESQKTEYEFNNQQHSANYLCHKVVIATVGVVSVELRDFSVALGRGAGGGGGWQKALVVGSVSLWRRLLASRRCTFCYDKQASALLRASPCLGGRIQNATSAHGVLP